MTGSDRAWMRHGSCLAAPGLPWTSDAHKVPSVLAEEMTEICGSCPVRLACTAYVCNRPITGGFWAGADRGPNVVSAEMWEGVERVPQRTPQGRDVGEQATLPLDGIGVA
jgi:hypothetical protein